jgi:transcriptional regulator with XRE-family HTH domain
MEETIDILSHLGRNIKTARKLKQLSQLELEILSGIDTGDLSRIENGLVNITFTKLIKLAKALGLELNDLYAVKSERMDQLRDDAGINASHLVVKVKEDGR